MKTFVFSVSLEDAFLRLDKYLASHLQGYSRQSLIKAIREGKILVNGFQTKPSYHLKAGDQISGSIIEPKLITSLIPLDLIPSPDILYEDQNFLVINKPAGVNTHPTIKTIQQPSIASWLVFHYPETQNVGEDKLRPGIVHRLDKETSGVLILVKNQPTFVYFKNLFARKQIQKEYLALVKGNLPFQRGVINFSLTRSKTTRKRKVVLFTQKTIQGEDKAIKTAFTTYQVVQRLKNYTLLQVEPKTGRTHQIRVHLASIGFPLAGDKIYGGKNLAPQIFQRQMLHAKRISFRAPTGEWLSLEAPLPQDFQKALEMIAKN